jgi:glycosyltransferase involved in cell wall biosynthesis
MLQDAIEKVGLQPQTTVGQGRFSFVIPLKHDDTDFHFRLPTVSVVIPTLNEEKNLPYVLPRIPEWVHEVLIVDGLSTDNTIEVAKSLRKDVKIVIQKGKGKGAALRSGFEAAEGEIIVMLDADGSTDPAEIPAYVGALLAGADFAKGSRFLQGGGTTDMEFHRKMGNWGFTMASKLMFGGNFTDLCYGYNAFWRRVLPHLNLDCDGFEVETLMNVRALYNNLKIAEIPSFESPRIHGTSNLRALPDGWRVLKTLVRERAKVEVNKKNDGTKRRLPVNIHGTAFIAAAQLINLTETKRK